MTCGLEVINDNKIAGCGDVTDTKQEDRNEGIEKIYDFVWVVYCCQYVYVVFCGYSGSNIQIVQFQPIEQFSNFLLPRLQKYLLIFEQLTL